MICRSGTSVGCSLAPDSRPLSDRKFLMSQDMNNSEHLYSLSLEFLTMTRQQLIIKMFNILLDSDSFWSVIHISR